jgi:hypothetical protein
MPNQPLHQYLFANIIGGSPNTTPDIGSLADAPIVPSSGISVDTSSPPSALAGDFVSDGSQQLISTDAGMPAGQSPWTVCGWVNTDNSNYNGLFCWGTPYGDDYTWLNSYVQPGGTVIAFFGSASASVYGSTAVNNGSWHHVAITFDGSRMRIYVDGVADSVNFDSVANPPVVPMDIALGGTLYLMCDVAGNNFQGSAADFRVYSYALSPGEISSIYDGDDQGGGAAGGDVWGLSATAGFPAGSMGALLNTIGNATAPSTSQIAAAILANPSNLLNTDGSGNVSLSSAQTFDGVSMQSLMELLVAAFVTGRATVSNNGNGTNTITRYKQDGSTAKYSVTFKSDGTITAASILA